jgi:hypothetical protein
MSNRKTIFCAGGCGRSVSVRRAALADYYVCDTRENRDQCLAALPPRHSGTIRVLQHNAAAGFMGVTDKMPDAEDHAAIARAKRLERIACGTTDRVELAVIQRD